MASRREGSACDDRHVTKREPPVEGAEPARHLREGDEDGSETEDGEDEKLGDQPRRHRAAYGVPECVAEHRAGERGEKDMQRQVVAQPCHPERHDHRRYAADEADRVPGSGSHRPADRHRAQVLVAPVGLLVGHELGPEDQPDCHQVDDRHAGRDEQGGCHRDVDEKQGDSEHEPDARQQLDDRERHQPDAQAGEVPSHHHGVVVPPALRPAFDGAVRDDDAGILELRHHRRRLRRPTCAR